MNGKEFDEAHWTFNTVIEVTDFDMGAALCIPCGGKCPDGWTPIVHAKYHWPIYFRVDKNTFIDCESLAFNINSRGVVKVWKKSKVVTTIQDAKCEKL
jgi:hypothetical protein